MRVLAGDIGGTNARIAAVGLGLPLLGAAALATLQEGVADEHGPMALLGAGTGLGQGFVIWSGGRHRVLPSEGGHADLAPAGAHGAALFEALRREFGHVSWERILSGPGLGNVYRLLAGAGVPDRQPAVEAEMRSGDPAEIVTRHVAAFGLDAAEFEERHGEAVGSADLTDLKGWVADSGEGRWTVQEAIDLDGPAVKKA